MKELQKYLAFDVQQVIRNFEITYNIMVPETITPAYVRTFEHCEIQHPFFFLLIVYSSKPELNVNAPLSLEGLKTLALSLKTKLFNA